MVLVPGRGKPLIPEVLCGSTGVSSGSTKILHFGFGANPRLKTVTLVVSWPSGIRQTIKNVKVNRLITITEPKA